MHIGDLAKQSGVSIQTVRYYERFGLLNEPHRKPSRYRVYSDIDLARVRFILHAKRLGFTLGEIKHILQLREQQACPCCEVRRIGETRLQEVDAHIQQLIAFRNELARAVKQWKRIPDQAPSGDAICALIERTMNRGVDTSIEGKKNKWPSNKAKSTSVRIRNAVVKSR